MGCNIHTHIEVQKDGMWHHYSAPSIRRDYFLYAVIAGERLDCLRKSEQEEIRPVAKCKMLPDDITQVTRICYEQDKALGIHNISVLTAEDLVELQSKLYEYNPWVQRTGLDEYDLEHSVFGTYINGNTLAQHQGWDDLRVICWFDN